MTREQLVTMLWRFKGSPYVNIDNLGQFKDAAEVITSEAPGEVPGRVSGTVVEY